jgi:hypothetical protein
MTVVFPFRRVFGLVGAIRTGKDSVANFLSETRGFVQIAFADQIKEEFGISKEDFEAAKIAGNIEELRDKLWTFSADKKKEDPNYFIKKVTEKTEQLEQSVIITDIRTEEELIAFYNIDSRINRVYWVRGDHTQEIDEKGFLAGSKLKEHAVANCLSPTSEYDLRCIYNDKKGLYAFYQELDKFFFAEDIEDIWNDPILKGNVRMYLDQFEIKLKERRGI